MSDQPYIGPSTPVPSLQQLQQYLAGTLSEAEHARLEAALADNPYLADALEGLGAVADAGQMDQALGRLRAKTRQRLARLEPVERPSLQSRRQSRVKPKLHLNTVMAVAAGLAFLLASAYLFQTLRSPARTAQTEATSYAEPAPAPDLLALQRERLSRQEALTQVPPETPRAADPIAPQAQPVPPVAPAPPPVSPRAAPAGPPADDHLAAHQSGSPSSELTPLPAPVTTPAENEATPAEPRRREALAEEATPAVAPAPSHAKQTARDPAQMSSLQDAALAEVPTTPAEWLRLTQAYLDQGQPAAALQSLADMPAPLTEAETAQQQWLTYQAHAAAGHTRRARRILQAVAATEGPYQAQAQALLAKP